MRLNLESERDWIALTSYIREWMNAGMTYARNRERLKVPCSYKVSAICVNFTLLRYLSEF